MHITVGADPELFVTKNGKFRSAHGLIPGTKQEPFKVPHGAVQVDGMALEFNIDPVDNADDFVRNIKSVMSSLKDMVPGYEFAIVPSCRFHGAHFKAQPDEAKELGCTPDYDAYTLTETPKPDGTTNMRTASGHVHVGFVQVDDPSTMEHMIRCATLVKQLDAYLGVPSILYDDDVNRRSMYGKAGCFRPKPYGVEYRTLSNAWLLSEERMRFVFNQIVTAVDQLIAGNRPWANDGGRLQGRYINDSSRYYAAQYLRNHRIGSVQ